MTALEERETQLSWTSHLPPPLILVAVVWFCAVGQPVTSVIRDCLFVVFFTGCGAALAVSLPNFQCEPSHSVRFRLVVLSLAIIAVAQLAAYLGSSIVSRYFGNVLALGLREFFALLIIAAAGLVLGGGLVLWSRSLLPRTARKRWRSRWHELLLALSVSGLTSSGFYLLMDPTYADARTHFKETASRADSAAQALHTRLTATGHLTAKDDSAFRDLLNLVEHQTIDANAKSESAAEYETKAIILGVDSALLLVVAFTLV